MGGVMKVRKLLSGALIIALLSGCSAAASNEGEAKDGTGASSLQGGASDRFPEGRPEEGGKRTD